MKGNFSNHMKIVKVGKFAIYADRGKQRKDTDWGNCRRLCWECYLLRSEKPLLSSEQAEFIPLDLVKLTENYTCFCCVIP